MRDADRQTATMFSYLSPEALVPEGRHPLRAIRPLVNAALARLSGDFDQIYSSFGRNSIAPEKRRPQAIQKNGDPSFLAIFRSLLKQFYPKQ